MEATEKKPRKPRTVTKPYQKHKVGYKITVEHKMKELKTTRLGARYVLYVEVRVKSQTTTFRSRFNLIATTEEYVTKALNDPLVIDCLEYEKNNIVNSVSHHLENIQRDFSTTSWLRCYRSWEEGREISEVLYRYIYAEFEHYFKFKNITFSEDGLFDSFFNLKMVNLATLSSILFQLGHTEIEVLCKVTEWFTYFFEYAGFSILEESDNGSWELRFDESIYTQDIFTGFVEKTLPKILEHELFFDREEKDRYTEIVEFIASIVNDKDFISIILDENGYYKEGVFFGEGNKRYGLY